MAEIAVAQHLRDIVEPAPQEPDQLVERSTEKPHLIGPRDGGNDNDEPGVQWLHRIYQDPKRLWKRYLVNNPKFVWQITLELLGLRKQEA